MPPRPALSRGELDIIRTVWKLGDATLREVFEAIPKRRKLDYTTVQTYLRRLEAKGYLHTRKSKGRTKVYSPQVRPKRVIAETIDDLVKGLFDGDSLPLLHYLIHDRGMSDEEKQGLREMLSQWESQQDEPPER
jgi:predicted transcriptional regulator